MMTKIEQLKASYEAARGGKWSAPGYYEVVNDADELVCNDVASTATAEFIALANNMMPQLLAAAEKLQMMVDVFNRKDIDPLMAFTALEQARHTLEELTRT